MLISNTINRIIRSGDLAGKLNTRQIHPTATLLVMLLIIFTGASSYFALRLKRDIVPDERHHVAVSLHYSTTIGIPPDIPETYKYGYMGYRPYLYYWLNARLINLLTFLVPSISQWWLFLAMRFTSVIYATITVILAYLLGVEVFKNRWWSLLVVLLLTNTLMFAFLAGGVNYDNLVNLLCFAGIFFLVRVINRKPFYPNSLGWLICMLVGGLVKVTVLPLALFSGLAWLVFTVSSRHEIQFRPVFTWKLAVLITIAGLFLILNAALYGGNLIQFRSLSPACQLILTEEQCNENPVVRRDSNIRLVQGLTMMEVLRGAGQDPVEWFVDYYNPWMIKKTYGIFGHRTYYPNLISTFFRLFYIGVLLLAVRYWRKPSPAMTGLMVITFGYLLYLTGFNYNTELATNFRHQAIQGRYTFPVIGAGYVIAVFFIAGITNRWLRWCVVGLTAVLFLWSGPTYTLLQYSKEWLPIPGEFTQPQRIEAELASSLEVSQEFVSECNDFINQFAIVLSPAGEPAAKPLALRLTDIETQQVVFEKTQSVDLLKSPHWYYFDIPLLQNSKDRPYRFAFSSPGSSAGNGVMIWGSNGDAYSGGLALVNGEPAEYDLSFRYYCRQHVLDGWFYQTVR